MSNLLAGHRRFCGAEHPRDGVQLAAWRVAVERSLFRRLRSGSLPVEVHGIKEGMSHRQFRFIRPWVMTDLVISRDQRFWKLSFEFEELKLAF